ncbi:biotin-dependent carboxyltransferase family protein [Chitinilyticum piscinae]|uniref:Biotin-dependent carboxyltransferase family protein n=1 Tax=Chitinilyticum piscinae TaxID=2866724 RepID=A0A8J7KBL9_9NEIS|nr:biotin-dependent carboxyltransferase family protein [Chitinilyticum piscinae]MBE9610369.1 biotin-dependent carboxyltransferase family protein [Chitinilyticum piscinae]
MAELHILKAGVLASVQDLGCVNAASAGMGQGGVADPLAARLANWLVGNSADAALIELTFGQARVRSDHDCWLALTGAPAPLSVDGRSRGVASSFLLPAGAELQIGAPNAGLRSYLAVAGGLAVPQVQGSRSTRLAAGFGGWQGRALAAGDRLPLGESHWLPCRRGVRSPGMTDWVRVLPGPQVDWLDAESRALWHGQAWQVSPQSNRMGLRLSGESLVLAHSESLFSHPVLPGTIQLPPAGLPIVLLADAQLTGGYPVIGQVIAADLWRCAQWRPGQAVRFVPVDEAAALTALRAQQQWLQHVQQRLLIRW